MQRLQGRAALVTGGASGLGLAIAQRLSGEGAIVLISDIQRESGQSTARQHGWPFFEQDVGDEARWQQVIGEIETNHGPLSVLVNNAGIVGATATATPEDTALSEWRRIFAVNVEGVFLGCRAVIPHMRKARQGSIINIASVAALLATPYATAYGASKAAVRQLTKSVAQHCAEKKLNIRCNSVHPGIVRTSLWEKRAREEAKARGVTLDKVIAEARDVCPLGDFTLPEDVAAAVAFLASDDARCITGAELMVDGGIVSCDTFQMTAKKMAAAGDSSR